MKERNPQFCKHGARPIIFYSHENLILQEAITLSTTVYGLFGIKAFIMKFIWSHLQGN